MKDEGKRLCNSLFGHMRLGIVHFDKEFFFNQKTLFIR